MKATDTHNKIDYSGRTVDLLLLKTILNVPAVSQRVQVDVTDVAGEPMIVTGVEKLAQRFLLSFVNALGSTKFMENHGTDIVPDVAKGMIYNESTLQTAAATANLIARTQIIKGDDGLDTPDDETLVASDVIGLEFSREKSKIKISIKLTTAAGTSYVYIIPVGVGIH